MVPSPMTLPCVYPEGLQEKKVESSGRMYIIQEILRLPVHLALWLFALQSWHKEATDEPTAGTSVSRIGKKLTGFWGTSCGRTLQIHWTQWSVEL